MDKESELKLTPLVKNIFELRNKKKMIDAELKEYESEAKSILNALKIIDTTVGDYSVHLKKVEGVMIADTKKMKDDGIFEKYSKKRAASETLNVYRLGDESND